MKTVFKVFFNIYDIVPVVMSGQLGHTYPLFVPPEVATNQKFRITPEIPHLFSPTNLE